MRNVVITGVGLTTPLGDTLAELAQRFGNASSAIRRIDSGTGKRVGAMVERDFTALFSRQQLGVYDRVSQLAIIAGDAAFANAGLTREDIEPQRAGVFLGCGSGPSHSVTDSYQSLFQSGSMKGLALLRCLPNAPASHLSMRWRLQGACQTYTIACASAAVALGEAMRSIRHGYLDLALAGGAEAPFGEGVVRAWEALRVLAAPDATTPQASCRPFAKNRSGIVLGEGAAFYILEAEEHARARGATVYATLVGYGLSADADHLTAPCPAGQASAMRSALSDAGLCTRDIGYINAHGTATRAGDLAETRSIRNTFGSHADAIPISSTKSMHGHLLGASGGIELAAAILALRDGLIPPTANLDIPDDECDLDYVANTARHGVRVRAAISNSFAFGGSNACLVVA